MSRREPLLQLTSIRTKLAVLVGASVLVTAVVGTLWADSGIPLWLGLPATITLALVVSRWLATGMTTPLQEMTEAADRMARGDHGTQITTSGRDEVGRLARAFATMSRDLAESEEHRRRLVATVAHELRTPLSAQQALLENLVDGVVTPDDAALRTALVQSERLGSLVTDLLDLSRPDGRGVPLVPSRVVVADLLAAAVEETTLQSREVRLVVDVEPRDLTVTGDRARLAQSITNLLDNAVRHSPVDGTVTLTARRHADRWSLTVADEGPGLSPERAERLFHRFGPGEDAGGGTGLGLAIAGWIAGMHGGSIRSVPTTGAGARLRMDLPLDPPDRAPDAAPLDASPTPDRVEPAAPHPPTAQPAPFAGGLAALAPARWWPERTSAPRPRLVLAALAVGVAAAALLPEHRVGLGLLLVLALGGAALWVSSPHRGHRWSWLSAALALPLAATTVLRDGPLFVFFAVATAGVLAAVACTDARTVTGIGASVLAWPASALRGLPLLDRTVRTISGRGGGWSVLRTGAVSLVLLLVFGGLLASADAVLGSWAAWLVPDVTVSDVLVLRIFTLVFFAGVTLAGLYLAINPAPVDRLRVSGVTTRRVPVREWQIPMAVVIVIFLAFVTAQVAALVGGHEYVLRTTGLTYAEYAREGFGQLTVATALVLLLVAGVRTWGRVRTKGDHRAMTGMAAVLCLLALLVVGSALRRMALYQDAFGYTTMRISVDLFEIWLGVVLLAVLVSLFVPARRWLGRALLLTGTAVVLVWSVGNTNAWVAEQNIQRYEQTGRLDAGYLARLSDDAVPAIHESALPETIKACIITHGGQAELDTTAEWNLARARAASIREGYDRPDDCAGRAEIAAHTQ